MSIDSRRGESCIRPKQNIHPNLGDHKDRPYGTMAGTIGRIIQMYKSITTRYYIIGVREHGWLPFPGKLWQRNYYEHIIRNEDELNRIRQYIRDNPLNWEMDAENPNRSIMNACARQAVLTVCHDEAKKRCLPPFGA